MQEWIAFDGGATIGKRGSEGGVILSDEEYRAVARMTLERDGHIAPLAITCGVYGSMMHTRFFSTQNEARTELAAMKVELARVMDNGADVAAIAEFVARFPG